MKINWRELFGPKSGDLAHELARLAADRAQLQAELEQLRETIYARTPAIVTQTDHRRVNLQRLLVLAGLGPDDQLWATVLAYADEHARNELQMALRPDLTDGNRQFNAGRASSAEDFAAALRDLRVRAVTEARRLKG